MQPDLKNRENEGQIKTRQWLAFAILLAVIALGALAMKILLSDKIGTRKTDAHQKKNFSSAFDSTPDESAFLEKIQRAEHENDKKTAELQTEIRELKRIRMNMSQAESVMPEVEKRLSAMEKEIRQLHEAHAAPSAKPETNEPVWQGNLRAPFPGTHAFPQKNLNANQMTGSGISETHLDLLAKPSSEIMPPVRNPETYVPAGTFVRAVMLGGADASAAVNASSDPMVMVFRILDRGTLPNHRKSHLKDCIALASVWGDISSERGQIRLTSLSCTFPDNRIVDQSVEGTVFGPGGKNGVRGTPVWREGALLQRAFAAGTLSGLSEGLSQTYTTNALSPEGALQTVSPGHIFQYGAAKGSGKAMDKLADYNIQRAEQYHPVIQLSAGTVVDIVFQKGFFLDGNDHAEALRESIKRENRKEQETGKMDAVSTLFPAPEKGPSA